MSTALFTLLRWQRRSALHYLLVALPLTVLSLVIGFALAGWMRALVCALGISAAVGAAAVWIVGRRTSRVACDEAIAAHQQRIREVTSLQEALAHELRNPLAAIKGLAGLMAVDPSQAPQRIAVLRAECCRMERILDEHLAFARPLTGLAVEEVSLDEALASVIALYRELAVERRLHLTRGGEQGLELGCDPSKLTQILMSLVHNAIDASPTGGAIELRVERCMERVRISVLDRGPGVPPEQLARVLKPGVTTKPGGTGLGLTVARMLTEQHGGQLSLDNRPGGGLAAVIELPAAPR